MKETIFEMLGRQLRHARAARKLNQQELAHRLGRSQARISEFERDLSRSRWGRDRLTLFAEMCDTLDLVPLLVPRSRAADIAATLDPTVGAIQRHGQRPSTFDELFVDLDIDGDEDKD